MRAAVLKSQFFLLIASDDVQYPLMRRYSKTSAEADSASVRGTIMWTVPLRVMVLSLMGSDSAGGKLLPKEIAATGCNDCLVWTQNHGCVVTR